ncbi:hypothetical protein N7517_010284 [Penicillium concentricum]|uniref:Peptidase S7 domain-containing protein n=1 Tax=Penicillium concentricum TaxID=293559 RepID=A0A9W9UU91_9EURO|nr:uncharacterized protein N7517_010284 [Penicillium concentricum]KAJ5355675.1 hypothetical protein N7517_010284 [Penicillium concentricum]
MPYRKTSKSVHKSEIPKNPTSTNLLKAPKPVPTSELFYVSKHDVIRKIWPGLLHQIVQTIDHTGVCILACVRRKGLDSTKITTTVLVVCDSKKPPSHRHRSIAKIRELLDRNRLASVAVEFVPGHFTRGVSDLHQEELDHRAIQQPSMISQSLALENANSSGTFAGFIELNMPGETEYKTLGLTCFHCVNPNEHGHSTEYVHRILNWRRHGIQPHDSMRQRLKVRHPSDVAIEDKIQSLNAGIALIREDPNYVKFRELERDGLGFTLGRGAKQAYERIVKTRAEMETFLRDINIFKANNRGAFGHIFAASGLRTTTTHTPDGHYLRDSPIPADLDGMPLFIHGQRSGYCKGVKHPLDSLVLEDTMKDGEITKRQTYEHSICLLQGPRFSQAGDSGSLVFTDSYVAVGMLFAGGNQHQLSFFTPIQDILDDIKHITKATNVRLKINRPGTSP